MRLARRADYKARSDEIHKFKLAYGQTISRFVKLLHYVGISHCLDPNAPEGFAALYFPKKKVLDTAADPEKAKRLLGVRDATSIREVQLLTEEDPTFRTLLELTIHVAEEQKFKNLVNILRDLLNAIA